VAKKRKPRPSLLTNLPARSRYVSRGGDKLRGALDACSLSVEGKSCLDVGSSTGGFTDCLLQAGAREVWAIDVGWGILDAKLRSDPRVHLLEKTNFRFFEAGVLPQPPELVTVDVSFISLDKILPKIQQMLAPGGEALVLVKPQFEGTPKEVPGGFVKDETTRQAILQRVRAIAEHAGFRIEAMLDSVVKGRKGNQETFLRLRRAQA
jgi:23S rRNA (cytidine1920-2'-O)/16S rRNA (cytidine1409-2'-O)-methyltransferase